MKPPSHRNSCQNGGTPRSSATNEGGRRNGRACCPTNALLLNRSREGRNGAITASSETSLPSVGFISAERDEYFELRLDLHRSALLCSAGGGYASGVRSFWGELIASWPGELAKSPDPFHYQPGQSTVTRRDLRWRLRRTESLTNDKLKGSGEFSGRRFEAIAAMACPCSRPRATGSPLSWPGKLLRRRSRRSRERMVTFRRRDESASGILRSMCSANRKGSGRKTSPRRSESAQPCVSKIVNRVEHYLSCKCPDDFFELPRSG